MASNLLIEQEEEKQMELKEHPVMITLSDAISGHGFLAGIKLSGRALMRKEEDGRWWMYGVRPAGIAAAGDNIDEAFLTFRSRYKEVLSDIAEESWTFDVFKHKVEQFFNEPDQDNEDERLWNDAVMAIRLGNFQPPDPFSKLPRESADSEPHITLERLDIKSNENFMPSDNVADTYSVPVAA